MLLSVFFKKKETQQKCNPADAAVSFRKRKHYKSAKRKFALMDAMCGSKAGSDLFLRLSLEKVAESSTTTAPRPARRAGRQGT